MKAWWSRGRMRVGIALVLAVLSGLGAATLVLALQLAAHWHAQASADRSALDLAHARAIETRQAQARLEGRAAQLSERAASALDSRPGADAAAARMADLMALALRQGVTVERVQRRDAAGGSAVDRVALTMPVSGGYLDLRQFIAEALRSDAALALERLRLRRADAGATQFDGELQWLLLHRPLSGTTP